jgi:protein SCO1/2
MKPNLVLVIAGILLGILLVTGVYFLYPREYQFQGSLIEPPVEAADFSLQDQFGQNFVLSEQEGRITLIFFGYTNCPDVCPVTLSEFKKIKQELSEGSEDVRFVFITVDPERDNPQQLGLYLSNFDDDFLGLSGSDKELEKIFTDYGVYAAKKDIGSAAGYLVDHTARTYLIDKQGNWRLTYPFGMEPEKIISDVRHLLSE